MATLPVPSFSAARAGLCLALMLVAAPVAAGWPFNLFSPPEFSDQTRDVIFVGNNWEGTVNVIDAETYEPLGTINAIPDKSQRITEIYLNPVRLLFFQGVRLLIGEGNHQYVDDMYSSNDGRLLVVSRPSFADVVALDVITGEVVWRFQVDGYRSDHMAISPDGKHVAVSASTGGVVHVLDVATGEEVGNFPSGDSPHENIYSEDGERIFHAAIRPGVHAAGPGPGGQAADQGRAPVPDRRRRDLRDHQAVRPA